jgi:hypothetical protein
VHIDAGLLAAMAPGGMLAEHGTFSPGLARRLDPLDLSALYHRYAEPTPGS